MSEDAVYDLLRRVQPSEIEPRLYDVIHLCPDLTDTLLSTVDTPMKIENDPEAGGQFVTCEFNRDLDSHRSPLSNKYYPPLPDGQQIPRRLRNIEIKANNAFNAYRHLYFQGGICSVYLWEIEDKLFGFGVFIKNNIDTKLRTGERIKGVIDCSDVVEVDESSSNATYTLTSSVLMHISIDIGLTQPLTIGGSTADRKVVTKPWKNDDDHIVNVGELVESNSAHFRDYIESIYISKMRQIIELMSNQDGRAQQAAVANELAALFAKRRAAAGQ
ncbi:F-actin-capping protein subunit beta [Histomonas meleagridis]|uniref:F-actin-capping protein subunit beta n=1 Tax=Histomonas meleagridis TaxID=135588 RepID=UPI00355A6156|nr:F-actin-capping protein subunit beta [Histomonas meleagridis]KAH0803330.1 F-actin-capping protein subunit beta [Histomonas meleagridis]